jgi:hypothetical protein
MSKTTFNIAYSGLAVESGVMNVKELAPALLSYGELLEEANRELNGESATVSVHLKADVKKGSFEISFEVAQSIVASLFGSSTVTAKEILEYIGLIRSSAGITLFGLIKWLKGRKPEKVTKTNGDQYKFSMGDNNNITVNKNVFNLYKNYPVRKNLEGIIKPLEKEGIDSLEIRSNNKCIESISKEETDSFSVPDYDEDPIIIQESEAAFHIISCVFKEGNKWRLADGSRTISAAILHEEFIERVNRNAISFAKDDILIVKLRTKQWQKPDGLKTEYEVVEVIDHKSALRQLPLFPVDAEE